MAEILRANADGSKQAAGERAFAAMAEEKIGAAGGAKIAGKNILRAQARDQELRAIGFAKIEVNILWRGLVAGGLHVEPLERIGLFAGAGFVEIVRGISELRGELGDEVGGDFVAAGTDGRADSGEQMSGVAGEFELHAANGFLRDAGECAAPAGVDGGYGSFLGIYEENGHAIGCLDAEEDARPIRGGGIAFTGFRAWLGEEVNHIGVNLLEWSELKFVGTEGGLKPAAIFEDGFAGVPFHEAEIENFFGFELA
jgi:hypothetical protein